MSRGWVWGEGVQPTGEAGWWVALLGVVHFRAHAHPPADERVRGVRRDDVQPVTLLSGHLPVPPNGASVRAVAPDGIDRFGRRGRLGLLALEQALDDPADDALPDLFRADSALGRGRLVLPAEVDGQAQRNQNQDDAEDEKRHDISSNFQKNSDQRATTGGELI